MASEQNATEATTGPSTPPPVVTAAPTLPTMLHALRRRWLAASVAGVVGGVAIFAAAWFLLPAPSHTARAQLYIAADPPRVMFQTSENRSDGNAFRQTQLALLKSRLVLNAALRQPKVAELPSVRTAPDPIAWIEKEIKVLYASSPEILSVTLGGAPPEELKMLVNAIVNAYLQEIVNKEQIKRQARLDQLEKISAKYQEALRQKRLTLRRVAENVGTGDKQAIALKQVYTQEQYHLTQKELLQVRSDLRKLETEAMTGVAETPELPESLINEFIRKDPLLAKYTTQLAQLEDDKAEAKTKLVNPDKHPSLQRYDQAIVALQQLIAKRKEQLKPQFEAQARDRMGIDATFRGKSLEKRIQYCRNLEKQLVQDVARLEEECQKQGKGAMDFGELNTDISHTEDVARKVAEEVEKLSVEQQAPSRIHVLEEANIDWQDANARQWRFAGLAGLVGLVLIVAAIAWWEFRHRRVETVDQVVHGLGLRLIGTVPAQPGRLRRGPEEHWRNLVSESVSAVRTQILHLARTDQMQAFMIASAVPGEGKTSLASQLAMSLAGAGKKTVLVDCDLRSPAAHKLFEMELTPGCCEVLRKEVDPDNVLRPTAVRGLTLLPAGQFDPQVLPALAQHGLEPILEGLRRHYDFIIVDSSPVLPVADAVQVAQQVDGVIFSILRNVSQLPRVHAAQQRLGALGVPVLGAVVLGTQEEVGGYGYHAGHRPIRKTRPTIVPTTTSSNA